MGLLAAPGALWSYMRREASNFEITHTDIRLPKLKKPITLLHLSDFHCSPDVPFEETQKAIRMVSEQSKPDFICLTGDYMTTDLPDADRFRETLSPLAQLAPTYAIIGNHDFTRRPSGAITFGPMLELLQSCGFQTLFNEKRMLKIREQDIELSGFGDIWSGTCRPQRVLKKLSESDAQRPPSIILSHNPDSKQPLQSYDWDLMLCGHTHGGQLKIPFTNMRPILPLADKHYCDGLYAWNKRQIFITRGVGNQHGVRFNCRPELSLIKLLPEST